jgi:hypothetical protein
VPPRPFPDDPIPQLKRDAASALAPLLAGWNANDIGVIIGADQPRVSDIKRGKLERFSLETLIRFLHRMDQRVTLQITPRPPRLGSPRENE